MRKLLNFFTSKSTFIVFIPPHFNFVVKTVIYLFSLDIMRYLLNDYYFMNFPGWCAFYACARENLYSAATVIEWSGRIVECVYFALCFVCSKRNLYSYVPILIEIFILVTDICLWVAFSAQVSLIKIHGYQCLVECAVIAIQIYRLTVMSKQRKEATGICEPLDVTKFDDTK